MKVYVVSSDLGYGETGHIIEGVFSSEEKAYKFCEEQGAERVSMFNLDGEDGCLD